MSSRRSSTSSRPSWTKRSSTSARIRSPSRRSIRRTSRWSTSRWTAVRSRPTRPTKELRQAIRASESISDHIALKASPEGFEIVSEGDTDSVTHMVPKDLLDELQAKEAVRSLFPLDYFSNMVKAISSAPTVTLYLGSDYPVKIEFKIAGGKGDVKFLLAPRIESEG